MKILLITSEEWHDRVYANGVLTNWFAGFDAEFAQIYTSPGLPENKICHRYFQIDERQMVRSLLGGRRAGRVLPPSAGAASNSEMDGPNAELGAPNSDPVVPAQRQGIYKWMKAASRWARTPVVMLRDAIWAAGRYDVEGLRRFVQGFAPDVVFCPQLGTPKMWRLERLVQGMTAAPFIAFTGDDEASYEQVSYSPLFWLRRWYCHRALRRAAPMFSHYFMHSAEQARQYAQLYGLETSTLYKCADFPPRFEPKPVGRPITLVYAGRLYCNRWRTLARIGQALRTINEQGERMRLDIYTQEPLTRAQRAALRPEYGVYVRGSVTPEQLIDVYRHADVALHVESMDRRNRLATRVSFSTKIIDLMASTCAIMAVCWHRHCGYQYLRDNDAAICVDRYDDLLPALQRLASQPDLISQYARKAYDCGRRNHSRAAVQQQLRQQFEKTIQACQTSPHP